jgi:molybdopterin-guanine dinucleotide biosynthesis protein A
VSTPLRALVLAGGHSRRMAADKALLAYAGEPQLQRAMRLLDEFAVPASVSVRPDQVDEPLRRQYPQVVDRIQDAGPAAGILAAFDSAPDSAWLVLACDLPHLDAATLRHLLAHRDPGLLAIAYRSRHDGEPEPLCAIYEPAARAPLAAAVAAGKPCPRRLLRRSAVALLDLPLPEALDNVNTPEERRSASAALDRPAALTLRVQYFALLREQAGRSEETVQTTAATARELLEELRGRHRFTLPADMMKVAINGDFAEWERPLRAGDAVVFIPPVAGG